MAQPDTDEEEDISQFKVVSHPKSSADTLCKNIRNGDLSDIKSVDFNKLTKEEKIKIEEFFLCNDGIVQVYTSWIRWEIAKRIV